MNLDANKGNVNVKWLSQMRQVPALTCIEKKKNVHEMGRELLESAPESRASFRGKQNPARAITILRVIVNMVQVCR